MQYMQIMQNMQNAQNMKNIQNMQIDVIWWDPPYSINFDTNIGAKFFVLIVLIEKDQNCKLQFPQPDYWRRRSPDFRTVFGIMIGPFSFCEIGKLWGTNRQVNKQTEIDKINIHNQIWNHVTALKKVFYTLCG